MTKERNLLLIDLCARLPYNVKVCYDNKVCTVDAFAGNSFIISETPDTAAIIVYPEDIKPYLLPFSSITEEMLEELNVNGFFKYRDTIANVSHLESKNGISEEVYTYLDIECISFLIEYFHSHHIDYRGLIPKDLAIDVTNLNIYGKRI